MKYDISHLKRFSTIRSGQNIKFLTPAVYSGGWCPMRVACNICEDIEGLSYLMVGMPECATYSRGMSSLPEGARGELRRTYVLDANEVIFGCRAGVIDALRVMDREGARAILMIATCVTDLIGEDLEGLINEAQPELGARLSYVTLGQFKNFGSGIGTWKTAEALGSLMSAKPADPGRANALFIEPWHNKNERVKYPRVVGALEDKGVKIRRIAAGATLDDYLEAPDAAQNLVLSSLTQPLAAKMESRFGTTYAPLHNAFSVAGVDAAHASIEAAFGIRLGDAFGDWREAAVKFEERARKELAGLKFALLPGVDMPAAFALYLAGFGMEPLLISVDDLHGEDAGYAARLKSLGYDPPVCRIMNIDHDVEVVRSLGPDISFGYINDPVDGFLCAEEMGDYFGVTGYERTAGILARVFGVLETGSIGERIDLYGAAPF